MPGLDALKSFWGRRSRRGKIAIIVVGVVVGLSLIGALTPTEGDDTASTSTVAEETTSDTGTTQEPSEAEPSDTGRLSESEYETFASTANDFDGELAQYGEVIGRCGVLMQAIQLAEASACVEDAWGGVWDSGQTAYFIAGDLLDDTAKGCRKALVSYQTRLDLFATALKRSTEAGMNLNFEEFTPLARRANRLAQPYGRARDSAHLLCVPV